MIREPGNSSQNTFKIEMSLVFEALVGCRFLKLVVTFSMATFFKEKVVCELTLLFKGYYASIYLKFMVLLIIEEIRIICYICTYFSMVHVCSIIQ